MANKMLIDASHPEETRVVVVKGNRVEEFDFESEHKKQLKGNIYLAKVTRVEPSLQAAFVEYGGNRHGFLAFSEIHPDYYQIPVADRQALIEEELARAAEEEEPEERPAPKAKSRGRRKSAKAANAENESVSEALSDDESGKDDDAASGEDDDAGKEAETSEGEEDDKPRGRSRNRSRRRSRDRSGDGDGEENGEGASADGDNEADQVDDLGSEDAMEEVPVRNRTPRKQYKIQEVIKRRQILLVQVVKEERGNKGAALTTYLSLAGRYSVLMPNTARGGGISRKITNAADRKRLKEVARDLEVPRGMGIILRTAGANRTRAEVKRDYEYLMRLWEMVRTLTLQSSAPALVYEEGSLIKRSIRDLFNKDIDQILVSGESGYREAKDFMRMLMPSQAKAVQPYRDPTPIFSRQGIEVQLDKMLQPSVTLKSGGYIIINQTEALVAIDVNSGRSTREHSVEDTAYQTNLEAAEEVARQLRLRDLAGLIVIDFIDMDEKRNNRAVEKKLKDCLKNDRARIQVGRISHFGLMEMSRQRIRASVLESTMQPCPVCSGNGYIRSESSLALHVLRTIEEHLQKHGTHDIIVKVPPRTALYVLNEKRSTITDLERLYGLHIMVEADENSDGHQHVSIEHGQEATGKPTLQPVQPLDAPVIDVIDAEDAAADEAAEAEAADESAETEEPRENNNGNGNGDESRRRRRRRRRGGRRDADSASSDNDGEGDASSDENEDEGEAKADAAEADGSGDDEGGNDDGRKRRRRGRRGGRRNRDTDAAEQNADGEGSGPVAEAEPQNTDLADIEPQTVPDNVVLEPLVAESDGPVPAALAADENEVTAASVEESASLDSQAPLDEVFPDTGTIVESDTIAVDAEEQPAAVEPEAPLAEREAANDQPEPVSSTPRVISNGEPADEDEADAKPKRSGWWSRKSFF